MGKSKYNQENTSIPTKKLSRLLGIGGMTVGIAGNIFFSASKKFLNGEKPNLKDLLITQGNLLRFTKQLLEMRGAALKVGQLLSLESGDFLPSEMSEILANLRNHAHAMPATQLKQVLVSSWGYDYMKHFEFFQETPLAAASIGQVHKCMNKNGGVLAIKVQYPGVKESIDSDMDALGFILDKSGLIPPSIDFPELIKAGREQLHRETDYEQEARHLDMFFKLMAGDKCFEVPRINQEFTTDKTLAMEFKEGVTIDQIVSANYNVKNKAVLNLIDLFFRELFEFNLIQSDPNYANFLFNEKNGKIILLDFGATIPVSSDTLAKFKALFNETLGQNKKSVENAMYQLGILDKGLPSHILNELTDIYWDSTEPIRKNKMFDFGNSNILERMQELSSEIIIHRKKIKIPPFDILSIQRKIGGIFLLARRFEAKINLNKIFEKYI